MTTQRQLAGVLTRNTAWNYAGFVVNIATNLIMFPYVVRRLGDAAAGVWLLLAAMTGYMGLLELGIVPSLTQTIASALSRDRRDAVSRAASSAHAMLVCLAAVSLLLLAVIPHLVGYLRMPPDLVRTARTVFTIAVIGFALRMPLATYQGVLLGCQRQDRCNQLWISIGLAKAAGTIIVLGLGFGLVGLVAWEMTVHLAAGVLQFKWVHDELPDLRISLRLVGQQEVLHLVTFGSAILAVTVCSLLIEQTDRFVIAAFLPVAMVTYYSAGWKVYMLAFSVTTTFVQAMSPVAADLHGRGDKDKLQQLFLSNTRYSAIVAWPLVLSASLAGGFVLRIWMGGSFVQSLPVVQVLAAGFAITAHNHAGYSALIGIRRVGPTVWRYFAPQAALNLMLSIWLVQRIGIVGVALGTMIPTLLLEYFFIAFVLREMNVRWREFLGSAVWPIALPAVLSYSPLMVAYTQLDRGSSLLFVVAAACTAVYGGLVWRSLGSDERAYLRQLAKVPSGEGRRARASAGLFAPGAVRPHGDLR